MSPPKLEHKRVLPCRPSPAASTLRQLEKHDSVRVQVCRDTYTELSSQLFRTLASIGPWTCGISRSTSMTKVTQFERGHFISQLREVKEDVLRLQVVVRDGGPLIARCLDILSAILSWKKVVMEESESLRDLDHRVEEEERRDHHVFLVEPDRLLERVATVAVLQNHDSASVVELLSVDHVNDVLAHHESLELVENPRFRAQCLDFVTGSCCQSFGDSDNT